MKISERLCEKIEEKIATGELSPGSALDEATLIQEYCVSRTPVREALIQLAAQGLIEIRPRRGAVVTSIGPARLIEMFEVMGELESLCGRLAARRMKDSELSWWQPMRPAKKHGPSKTRILIFIAMNASTQPSMRAAITIF